MSGMKIDVFPHIYPPPYFERTREILPAFFKANVMTQPSLSDLAARFRMMDRYEGYVQAPTLSAPPIEQLATGQLGIDLAKLTNEGREAFVRETIAAVEEASKDGAQQVQLFEGNARRLLGLH